MTLHFTQTDVMEWLNQSTLVLRDILGQSQAEPVISDAVQQEFFSKLKIVAEVVAFLARQEQQGNLTGGEQAVVPDEGRTEMVRRLAEIRALAFAVAEILRSRKSLLN